MTNSDSTPPGRSEAGDGRRANELAAAHMAFGWWTLLGFLVLGIVLEGLHSLKVGLYLDASNETRRLLWTLSHAHGTLLALVHVAFAVSLPKLDPGRSSSIELASRCLYAGALTMPAGFFLGGAFVYEGDPGLAIVLAPIGAVLVALAVALIARATARR